MLRNMFSAFDNISIYYFFIVNDYIVYMHLYMKHNFLKKAYI